MGRICTFVEEPEDVFRLQISMADSCPNIAVPDVHTIQPDRGHTVVRKFRELRSLNPNPILATHHMVETMQSISKTSELSDGIFYQTSVGAGIYARGPKISK
jgi:hypothetical protein